MSFLYITEQGAKITRSGNRIIVEKDNQKLVDIPLIKISTILIYGNVQITTQAMRLLLENGIDTALFNYYGKFFGTLSPPKSKNVQLRIKHFEKARLESVSLEIALKIVHAKIGNMRSLLTSHLKNYSDPEISKLVRKLDEWEKRAEFKQKAQTLLGIEGSATVCYYQAFRRMFRGELRFNGRNRRPPEDEVNALMSYTYAILGNEFTMLLNAFGLDPYLGFYHGVQYGRASLAMDMLEPFRPVCDRLVLNLVNLEIMKKADFEKRDDGIYLKDDSKKKYFAAYEKYFLERSSNGINLRDQIKKQLESLIRFIMDKGRFEPYTKNRND